MYSNKLSSAGGQISNDMTDGYGPEEYAVHRAPAGPYHVRINGYDADRINPNGPTTCSSASNATSRAGARRRSWST